MYSIKTSIISNLQDVTVPNSQQRLKKPFEQLFEIQMLDQVEIGRYLTGFTRYSRNLGVRREISYAPYIGHILKTKGLLFELNDLPIIPPETSISGQLIRSYILDHSKL